VDGGALVGFEIGQKGLITTALNCDMATFVYRCPTTGLNVQGWFADDPSEHEGEIYEAITCVACTRVHLINRSAGRVLGGDDEERQTPSTAFPGGAIGGRPKQVPRHFGPAA
jgi:hypothetical protein